MTRTIVPGDFERADPWTATYFSQLRSICKAQTRFRNSGYKRKFDKKKVRCILGLMLVASSYLTNHKQRA
eukprot:931197-Prorocentrum_minimum.AAC.3